MLRILQRRRVPMSLQDTVTKQYVSDPKVFADAFNYLIYSGRQVIPALFYHSEHICASTFEGMHKRH